MAAAPRLRPLHIHKGAGMRRARRIRRPEGEEDGEAGRVVLRRIEDRVHRGICFRKRLAVLCDTHVGFVVLSCSDGRLHPLRRARQGKDFHIPKETTDKGPNNDDMRSIDETDISTLNMDQLSQVERLLEDELRWTRARKVVVDRIARLQKKVRGKAAILEVERGSMEIPKVSGQEKEQVGGEVASLRIGAAAEQRHRTTPLDLNMPGWDAGPLQ